MRSSNIAFFQQIVIALMFLLGGQIVGLPQRDRFPENLNGFEPLESRDSNQPTSVDSRNRLIREFTRLYIRIARAGNDFTISPKEERYLSLKKLAPGLASFESERGVSLESIVRFLNADPADRKVINSELTKAQMGKVCEGPEKEKR